MIESARPCFVLKEWLKKKESAWGDKKAQPIEESINEGISNMKRELSLPFLFPSSLSAAEHIFSYVRVIRE